MERCAREVCRLEFQWGTRDESDVTGDDMGGGDRGVPGGFQAWDNRETVVVMKIMLGYVMLLLVL